MSRIQTSDLSVEQNRNYDPLLCKTCQKLNVDHPLPSRARFSDCEEHFHERVTNMLLTGLGII